MNPLIDVQDLTLSIPTGHIFQGSKNILHDISFQIQAGGSTAYLGANGAGKTSTFRVLCGLIKKDKGKVFFDGKEMLNGLPPKRFGFMPEQPYFYKNLSPLELLTGLGKLSGIHASTLKKNIYTWAERLNFVSVLNQRLSTCSKGQVQRVGLAQALIHQPDFILLDEPLSGLDPIGRSYVRNVIQDEIKRGATVLFSSHILSDAEAICNQVVILKDGHNVFSGDIKQLLSSKHRWLIKVEWPILPTMLTSDSVDIHSHMDGTSDIRGASLEIRNTLIQQILADPRATLLAVEAEQRTLEQAFVDFLQVKVDKS